MSVTVTLNVYSGRPNPGWELSDAQVAELTDRLASIDQKTLMKPPGIVGGLGYRGFTIESVRERYLEPQIYVHGGIIDLARFDLNLATDTPDLEQWLLSTGKADIEVDAHRLIQQQLAGPQPFTASTGPSIMAVPPFSPGKWNNDPAVLRNNNCYNYANDKITNTFAQPGTGSGRTFSSLDCNDVGAAAQRDGQVSVPTASSTPPQGHFIALVIWPGSDYHWYRLDDNAQWSHKPGQTPARNTDNSGSLIADPQTCDRGPYTVWCSYYHCVPASTRIR